MLTIKAEVQKDRKRTDGTYNVKIRFTKDRTVKRISTDIFVSRAYKSHFNNRLRCFFDEKCLAFSCFFVILHNKITKKLIY